MKRENFRGISITNTFIKFLGNVIKISQKKNVIKEMRKKVVSLKEINHRSYSC
jgi:hypothetical protein